MSFDAAIRDAVICETLRCLYDALIHSHMTRPNIVPLSLLGEQELHKVVKIVNTRWTEKLVSIGLALVFIVPSFLVICVVSDSWINNPSNRYWIIIGLGFYIGSALKAVYGSLLRTCERLLFLRVEIRRSTARILFDAVSSSLATEADLRGNTCSWDVEAH